MTSTLTKRDGFNFKLVVSILIEEEEKNNNIKNVGHWEKERESYEGLQAAMFTLLSYHQ